MPPRPIPATRTTSFKTSGTRLSGVEKGIGPSHKQRINKTFFFADNGYPYA